MHFYLSRCTVFTFKTRRQWVIMQMHISLHNVGNVGINKCIKFPYFLIPSFSFQSHISWYIVDEISSNILNIVDIANRDIIILWTTYRHRIESWGTCIVPPLVCKVKCVLKPKMLTSFKFVSLFNPYYTILILIGLLNLHS